MIVLFFIYVLSAVLVLVCHALDKNTNDKVHDVIAVVLALVPILNTVLAIGIPLMILSIKLFGFGQPLKK